MLTCSKCGATYGDNFKFCPFCGEKSGKANTCPNCSNEIKEGSVFCDKCGRALKSSTLCKVCGTANADTSAYCNVCGHALKSSESTDLKSDVERIKAVMPMVKNLIATGKTPAQAVETVKAASPEMKPIPKFEDLKKAEDAKKIEDAKKAEEEAKAALVQAPISAPVPVQQIMPQQPYVQPIVQPIVAPMYPFWQQPTQQSDQQGRDAKDAKKEKESKKSKVAVNEPIQGAPVYNIYTSGGQGGYYPGQGGFPANMIAPGAKPKKRINNITPIFAFLFTAAFIASLFMDFYFKGPSLGIKGYELLGALLLSIPGVGSMGLFSATAGMDAFMGLMAAHSGNMVATVLYWVVLGGMGLMSLIMALDLIACFVRICRGRIKKGVHRLISLNFLFALLMLTAWFSLQFVENSLPLNQFMNVATPFFTMDSTAINTFDMYFLVSMGALFLRFLTPAFAKRKKNY